MSENAQTDRETALRYLGQALGSPRAAFKEGQWESVEKLLANGRLLVVQRTGWGKSMVYFLATRLLRDRGRGLTLLISPLLSLMRNQLAAAEKIGIRARTINSSNEDDWAGVLEELRQDRVDVLLVSPERLSNPVFREFLPSLRPGLLVIDEAHCISDWGHDFRPDYRAIVRIVEGLPPNVPILATTATANDRVIEDIRAQLGAGLELVRGPLLRKSLRLQNIFIPGTAGRLAWLAAAIPSLEGSGIVYVLTVRDAESVSRWLQSRGIAAMPYYGSLPTEERERLETALIENRIKVLVATVALGMGFDKPDLGFVIHFQRPASVVHYYQQVGRAGRALDTARGVLLSGAEDDDIVQYFIDSAFPPQAHVRGILDALDESENGLNRMEIEEKLNLSRTQIEKTLKFLSIETRAGARAPVVKDPETKRYLVTPYASGYRLDEEYVRKITEIRYAEQEQMKAYMSHRGCLMRFLQDALDDDSGASCGRCQNCDPARALPEGVPENLLREANIFLRRNNQPIPPKKQWPSRRQIPSGLRAEEGCALCCWRDGGWGDTVADDKCRYRHFSEALVNPFISMLRERYPVRPFGWITCVPSLRSPVLVQDFAQRVAFRLQLPFVSCLARTRESKPQTAMRNSAQQIRNIQDVFRVTRPLAGACLLIDDTVGSGWTLTLISALLREAGCRAVYPAVLAKLH